MASVDDGGEIEHNIHQSIQRIVRWKYIILLNGQLTLKKLSVLEVSRIVTKIYQHVINCLWDG